MKPLSDKAIQRLRREAALPDLTGTKYRLIEKIGSGGMGEVYLVEDTDLNRNIALKVIGGPALSDDLSARLLKEAKIVARLEHPSIVPVHDAGKLMDGRTYFTMKYVQGESLETYARNHQMVSDLLRTFHKICEAVAFAHSRGVIHRDLKPENVMVGEFGEVLVMDWGIAKIVNEAEDQRRERSRRDNSNNPSLTAEGTVMGTPYYMSPEQALGQSNQIDHRADIYSLGGILYFLLTRQHPGESDDQQGVDTKQTTKERTANERDPRNIERPRKVDPKIGRAIEAICLKSMSASPNDRYNNADLLGSDILSFLDAQPVSAYPENIFEKTNRWVGNNRFVIYLILTYLVMRFFLFLLIRR